MNSSATTATDSTPACGQGWRHGLAEIAPRVAERACQHDIEGRFVADNLVDLRDRGLSSLAVPAELGGSGAAHAELGQMLRILAHSCPATALTLSMHTHLVATMTWRWRRHGVGEELLTRVARDRLMLVSTGATDWVESSGEMQRVEDGYVVTARKPFASGCEEADLLVTSSRFEHPEEGPLVLHFTVPFDSDGLRIEHDWDAHGMRGTGSHTVSLERVFVPDGAVSLRRPQGRWPTSLDVVVTLAMPLIMSVYLGVAEAAAHTARTLVGPRRDDPDTQLLVGEMETGLVATEVAVDEMLRLVRGGDVEPSPQRTSRTLAAKSIAARAAVTTVEKALEVSGGRGYSRITGLERLLRDVRAAGYHPLPEHRQRRFTGRIALGLDPVG